MTIDIDVDDSTELLYATLQSDEDIPDESLDEIISNAVSVQIRQLYNNREEVKEQLAGGESDVIEAAKEE